MTDNYAEVKTPAGGYEAIFRNLRLQIRFAQTSEPPIVGVYFFSKKTSESLLSAR